ncbi:MAG TPA: YggS family pyridoxal phosphate-dependent enzyme [Fredinandcohnia sp.]|nr:YggS family pyridoxal phosphate-dependent enzyme [Fredinandcohnia sp.]
MEERRTSEVAAAIEKVRRRIDDACRAAGRDPGEVRLLLASKTQPPERILQALEAGVTLFGENRVQELVEKARALEGRPIEWHFIGHLQRNKIRRVLDFARVVQSVDRPALVDDLVRELEKRDARLRVFLQVNTSGEASKFGVRPEEAEALARHIASSGRLELEGLMTIALHAEDPEGARPCFRLLRAIRDDLRARGFGPLRELSMGMSGDLEVAIEEGATIVRVGTAAFGARAPA